MYIYVIMYVYCLMTTIYSYVQFVDGLCESSSHYVILPAIDKNICRESQSEIINTHAVEPRVPYNVVLLVTSAMCDCRSCHLASINWQSVMVN